MSDWIDASDGASPGVSDGSESSGVSVLPEVPELPGAPELPEVLPLLGVPVSLELQWKQAIPRASAQMREEYFKVISWVGSVLAGRGGRGARAFDGSKV